MSEEVIHHVELKESVLHDRLCQHAGVDLPFELALTPGKVNIGQDICAYTRFSGQQERVSMAKNNFKRLCRVYGGRWRSQGIRVDLSISVAPVLGSRRWMLASMPGFHAKRLEALFKTVLSGQGIWDVWSNEFDPYIITGLRSDLFTLPTQETVS